MKKSAVVVSSALACVALAGLALVYGPPLEGQGLIAGSDLEALLHSDSSELENKAQEFLEHLQYRDFEAARDMYNPSARHSVQLKTWLSQQFEAPAEELNLRDLEIEKVDISSDGRRARTHFRSVAELIAIHDPDFESGPPATREAKGILFWRKQMAAADEAGPRREVERWYLQPESAVARQR